MATNVIKGKEAYVKVATHIISQTISWSIAMEGAEIDVTTIGDDWGTYKQGIKRWTATLECIIDMTDTLGQLALAGEMYGSAGDGDIANVFFQCDRGSGAETTNGYFYGDAIVTGMTTANAGVADVVKATFTFRGDGDLNYQAAT